MPKLAALLLLGCLALYGQGETTSAIAGMVGDPSGAAVPGAKVTAVGTENGLKRAVQTDDAGRFSFPQLKPGSYAVKVEAEGFAPQTKDPSAGGTDSGQKQTTVTFTLNLAAAKGDVTVTGNVPLVNPENPNTSTTLNARALENLPNPGGDLTYTVAVRGGRR